MGFFYDMKVCSKCKVEKEFSEFSKNKKAKNGLKCACKMCDKIYILDNSDKLKQYRLDNSDKRKENLKQWHLDNPEYRKKYNKQYGLKNKDKINKYKKNRKLTNPLFKLSHSICSSIGISIKKQGYSKTSRTHEILGCSYEDFKIHLENKFTKGMTWSNYGSWHLDHIYPVSLATDEEHLIKLNHYTNFQPLWAEDNIKKSNNIYEGIIRTNEK
jgi:hypothetical protein